MKAALEPVPMMVGCASQAEAVHGEAESVSTEHGEAETYDRHVDEPQV